MDCKTGGLVIYRKVTKEPVVREPDETRNLPSLVADLGVREVWQPQTEPYVSLTLMPSPMLNVQWMLY